MGLVGHASQPDTQRYFEGHDRPTEYASPCESVSAATTQTLTMPGPQVRCSRPAHFGSQCSAQVKETAPCPSGPTGSAASDASALSQQIPKFAAGAAAGQGDDEDEEEDDDPDTEQTPVKRRSTAVESAMQRLNKFLHSVDTTWSWAAHWDGKRSRDFDNVISRLNSAGRKCGNFVANADALALAEKAFATSSFLTARAKIFDKLKTTFIETILSNELAEEEVTHFANGPKDATVSALTVAFHKAHCLVVNATRGEG